MEAMRKTIELWLFRRLERPPTLHRHQQVQQDQFRTIQLVARFHLLADSPSTTQYSRKWLMHRTEQEHQLLQTLVTQEHHQILRIVKISELRMQMETFRTLTMIRTATKSSNLQLVKVLHSLLKRRKTVQLDTTSLVSTK